MENKKTLTVTQQVRELIYDIQNKSYLTGHSRESDGANGYEAASNMQVSDEAECSYQIRRSLTNAFSVLKSELGEYLSEEKTTSNNLIASEIEGDGVLTLVFELPGNYNNAMADSLGNGIHAYLVDKALGEWFAITNKADADTYIAHSIVSLDVVKRALYKRMRPERPTYS